MPSNALPRFHSQSGIAIGPILFVLAMLAVLAVVMMSGGEGFGTASVTDRISADTFAQASLIRTKINECNVKWGTNANYDGYPPSLDSGNNVEATLVSALTCLGDPTGEQNIWSGARATLMPPPTTGFGQWYYVNSDAPTGSTPCTINGASCLGGTASGGRCIYIKANSSNQGTIAGLQKAASKFTNNTHNDGVSEVNYDPSSSGTGKFVLWISVPAVGEEIDACNPDKP